MHLRPNTVILEILDERGRPYSGDEEGYFVWTGFLNRAMPWCAIESAIAGDGNSGPPCRCGEASPRVIPTITRESEILHCPDGRIFSPRALNQFLKKASLAAILPVHSRPAGTCGRSSGCKQRPRRSRNDGDSRDLQQLLGQTMRVTAEIATEPVIFPGGKIPLIVNRISQ